MNPPKSAGAGPGPRAGCVGRTATRPPVALRHAPPVRLPARPVSTTTRLPRPQHPPEDF